ncbi:MAG: gluconeogenesis factor YvcK family protein [Candidatus Poribacteria bacterium]
MKPLKVVCIGGGTGLSTLLRGIKQYVASNGRDCRTFDMDWLTAIVAVSDDGGSSGRLIDEFGVLPPGDIRNCLVALANEDEMMSQLFEYRFDSEGDLQGQSVGNLLLIALMDMQGTFPAAIQEASKVLAVRGRILPVTLDPTVLCAELANGSIVRGESAIPDRGDRSPIKRVFLTRRAENGGRATPCQDADDAEPIRALPDAAQAIRDADAVIIGPGSLFTSILPNIAVPEILNALQESSAIKLYVANVMVEPGETDAHSLSDHVNAIRRHGDVPMDYVLANSQHASAELVQQYHQAELQQTYHWISSARLKSASDDDSEYPSFDEFVRQANTPGSGVQGTMDRSRVQVLNRPGVDDVSPAELVEDDLISEEEIRERDATIRVLRHDSSKLAAAIVRLLQKHYNGDSPSA